MSSNSLLAQLVNLSHDMRRESISGIIDSSLGKRSFHSWLCDPLHSRCRDSVDLDRPDVLDDWESSHLGSEFFSRCNIVKLD